MCKQRSNWVNKLLLVFAISILHFAFLKAQTFNNGLLSNYEENLDRKNSEWVNSIGLYTGNLDEIVDYLESIPELLSFQIDYLRYKHINSRLAFGGGIALKLSPTRELGYEQYEYYRFAEIYGYAKIYLNNNSKGLYLDNKLGYSQAIGKHSIYYHDTSSSGPFYFRYSSSPTIQPGIGIEFDRSNKFRWGIKISYYHNKISEEVDLYPSYWEIQSGADIKSATSSNSISRFLIGFNFYI